jgi:DNA-binding SARP family transcriptional activator
MIRFNVLGVLELRAGNEVWVPRGPKVCRVLALLLLRPNQVVDIGTLAEELWADGPPRTTATTIRTHVYHLRKMLERDSGVPAAIGLLVTESAGYRLRVEEEQVDAGQFRRLVDTGRARLEQGRASEAATILRQALSLWRGTPLTGVPAGRVLARHLAHLAETRVRALELRIEADMRLGRHRELIAELRGLVAADPLNEWLHARLIEALHLSGRRGDALSAFRDLRRLLAEELGLEPSAELQLLQQEILTAGGRTGPQRLPAVPALRRAVS